MVADLFAVSEELPDIHALCKSYRRCYGEDWDRVEEEVCKYFERWR